MSFSLPRSMFLGLTFPDLLSKHLCQPQDELLSFCRAVQDGRRVGGVFEWEWGVAEWWEASLTSMSKELNLTINSSIMTLHSRSTDWLLVRSCSRTSAHHWIGEFTLVKHNNDQLQLQFYHWMQTLTLQGVKCTNLNCQSGEKKSPLLKFSLSRDVEPSWHKPFK